MINEIDHGVEFLCNLLQNNGADEKKSRAFCDSLRWVLKEHFNEHWDPAYPLKGSGYRCIRIHHGRSEPLMERAAFDAKAGRILEHLPTELTLWFDPTNVSYRIGENGGRIKTIYHAGAKEELGYGIPIPQQHNRQTGPMSSPPNTTLSPLSPPHTPQSHMQFSPPGDHRMHSHAPVYVPDSSRRQTPLFVSRSPPEQSPMDYMENAYMQAYSPYNKNNHGHNPHNLLMAAR